METIALDVLILGGGVQGLWLLNRLRRDQRSALLLETQAIGSGQTCHAHGGIHRGFMFATRPLAASLAREQLRGEWKSFTERDEVSRLPWFYGFRTEADGERQQAFWRQLGTTPIPTETLLPPVLADGSIQRLYVSPERCINTSNLVHLLTQSVEEFIGRVEALEFTNIDAQLVVATTMGGNEVTFRPRAVVVAAGSSNQNLMGALTGNAQAFAHNARMWHMLVVRGRRQVLPPLVGCFHKSLFLTSREVDEDVVWLFSDSVEGRVDAEAAKSLYIKWKDLVPLCNRDREKLRWGLYSAPAFEWGDLSQLPADVQIVADNSSGAWAVWPTKLTLAPLGAERLFDEVASRTPSPQRWARPPEEWLAIRAVAPCATERWSSTPLSSWVNFAKWASI